MKKDGQKSMNFLVLLCLMNAVVIYFASLVFPSDIVLGNAMLSGWAAVIVTSILLTLLLSLIMPIFQASKIITASGLPTEMAYYGIVNMLGLWLLARAAVYTGFGISSLFVAVILGLILTILRYGAREGLASKKSKR